MNELLHRCRPLLTAWLVLALGQVSGAVAQTSATIVPADFIVSVVNSEPVTNSEVQAMRLRLLRELSASGTTLPPAAQLNQQALELLINEKAQLQLAQEMGIRIDDDQIDQAEANLAASNQLTREALHQRLLREGATVASLRLQLRNQLTLSRLREREIDSRIKISEQDIDQYIQGQGVGTEQAPPELNMAMILVAVPETASADALKALEEKARDIARRARAGEDFAKLAQNHSQAADKGANGGELGLRPADRYPELFVDAVRQLPLQGIAGPIRSGAGFHVLKLLERRQPAPVMTVVQTHSRHILLRPTAQLSRDQAIARLQDARRQILSGQTTFARMAQQISQDGSASQGGDLGWTLPGQFVPEFEQVMNKLQPGQISDPLVSRFGVHILEVTERRKVAVPEKEQRDIARSALREKRLEEAYERWVEDVRGRAYVEMREPPQLQDPAPAPVRR